mmetsp:Transcript_6881/g.18659  ORF Transcript_6881/g.18659 Transcript_6881/m.18659 type:complete len:124 (-) Transcript_6881:747-1118(-)
MTAPKIVAAEDVHNHVDATNLSADDEGSPVLGDAELAAFWVGCKAVADGALPLDPLACMAAVSYGRTPGDDDAKSWSSASTGDSHVWARGRRQRAKAKLLALAPASSCTTKRQKVDSTGGDDL